MEQLLATGSTVFGMILLCVLFVVGWYLGWKFFVSRKDMWGKSPFGIFLKNAAWGVDVD